MGEIKIDLTRLNRKIAKAFEKTAEAYADQCAEEIQTSQFDWPRPTKRANGQVVGSPRDIVDTGDFADSQQPVVMTERGEDEIVATIEYGV